MKKYIIVSAVLCITLTGCSRQADSSSGKRSTSMSNGAVFISSEANYYENGMFFGHDTAMFLDFDTLEKAPLCAAPNCSHTTSSCLAKMVGDTPIIYNNYVYFFTSNNGDVKETPDGPEFFIDSTLMKASLDSSETETVCEFHDCAPPYKYGKYVLHDNELFFVGDDLNPVKGEYGGYSWGTSGGFHYLCSINLDTGKYTNYGSIYDGDKQYDKAASSSGANISGIYNNKMYIRYSFMKEDPEVSGKAPVENWTNINIEFDLDTNATKESALPYSTFMTNDIYTYFDFENKLTETLDGEEKYTVPYSDPYDQNLKVLNGKAFFDNSWYDLSDMSEHGYGDYESYDAAAYYDGCYILSNGGKAVKLTEEELLSLT